ncbi:MAG TPA: hypothetical protein VGL06_05470 [Pseudonocardiaceae bacterium]|jgi:hypothetical protein
MKYQHVKWRHDLPHQPTDIYTELDDDRWETRKVEVFADGRIQYSDGTDSTGATDLGEVRSPTPQEAPDSAVLTTIAIDEPTFEHMWNLAMSWGGDQPKS